MMEDIKFDVSLTEFKDESKTSLGSKMSLCKDTVSSLKQGNLVLFSLSKYLIYNRYSFTLSAKFSIRKLKSDNNGSYTLDQNFEKSYTLNPLNSIRLENTCWVQRTPGQSFGFVEASFINSMNEKAILTDFEIINIGNPGSSSQVSFIEFIGLNLKEQELKKRSVHKFIIKYRIDPNIVEIPDYGQIRFWWKLDSAESEGGALIYSIIEQSVRDKHPIQVERADTKILTRDELNDVQMTFRNL